MKRIEIRLVDDTDGSAKRVFRAPYELGDEDAAQAAVDALVAAMTDTFTADETRPHGAYNKVTREFWDNDAQEWVTRAAWNEDSTVREDDPALPEVPE